MERLERIVLAHRQAPVVDLVAALEQAIQDFVGSTAPFDDLAIVVAKCQR
jgi:serine phosphatase RsbU (regulator of sigma subunit)